MPFVTILPNEKLCPQGAKIEVKTGEKLAQSLNKALGWHTMSCQAFNQDNAVKLRCPD